MGVPEIIGRWLKREWEGKNKWDEGIMAAHFPEVNPGTQEGKKMRRVGCGKG